MCFTRDKYSGNKILHTAYAVTNNNRIKLSISHSQPKRIRDS